MKNSRRKEAALVASGIIIGASIAAPAVGAALIAQQSSQKIVVDGKPMQIEAYSMEERRVACSEQLENVNVQLANAKEQVERPFPQEEELKTKSARLDELNVMLNLDKRESEVLDDGEVSEEDAERNQPKKKDRGIDR